MSLRRIVIGDPTASTMNQVLIHAAKTQLSHSQGSCSPRCLSCVHRVRIGVDSLYLQEAICMTSGRRLCTWPTGRGIRMSGRHGHEAKGGVAELAHTACHPARTQAPPETLEWTVLFNVIQRSLLSWLWSVFVSGRGCLARKGAVCVVVTETRTASAVSGSAGSYL